MNLNRFQHRVTTIDELTALIGSPGELVIRKQLSELDHHMQAFIAESPFLLLGTYGRDGQCDVSPRGDLPAAGTEQLSASHFLRETSLLFRFSEASLLLRFVI
jgi:predicted pyridoxine 5'-phosphate oxidase superfamily flavin-nucleotide-binding protein